MSSLRARMIRTLLAAAGAVMALPVAASEKTAQSFARAMLEEIGARVVECPADVIGLPTGFLSYCAETDLTSGDFRTTWDRLADGKSHVTELPFVNGWLKGDSSCERHYEVDRTFLTVYRQLNGRLIAIVYDRDLEPCDASWRERHPPVLKKKEMKAAGISRPARKKAGPPPHHAVDLLPPMGGDVRFEFLAVVRKDGSVGDVCLLRAPRLDERSRLNRCAAARLRRYQYAPATKDGEPVEVTLPIKIAFLTR